MHAGSTGPITAPWATAPRATPPRATPARRCRPRGSSRTATAEGPGRRARADRPAGPGFSEPGPTTPAPPLPPGRGARRRSSRRAPPTARAARRASATTARSSRPRATPARPAPAPCPAVRPRPPGPAAARRRAGERGRHGHGERRGERTAHDPAGQRTPVPLVPPGADHRTGSGAPRAPPRDVPRARPAARLPRGPARAWGAGAPVAARPGDAAGRHGDASCQGSPRIAGTSRPTLWRTIAS